MVPLSSLNQFVEIIEKEILSASNHKNQFDLTDNYEAYIQEQKKQIALQLKERTADVAAKISYFQMNRHSDDAVSQRKAYDAALEAGENFQKVANQERELLTFDHCPWFRRDTQILRELSRCDYPARADNPSPLGILANGFAENYFNIGNQDETGDKKFWSPLFHAYLSANDLARTILKIRNTKKDRDDLDQLGLHKKSEAKERKGIRPHFEDLVPAQQAYEAVLDIFLSSDFIQAIPPEYIDAVEKLVTLKWQISQFSAAHKNRLSEEIKHHLKAAKKTKLVRSKSFKSSPQPKRLIHLLSGISGLREPLIRFRHLERQTLKVIQSLEKLADQMDLFLERNSSALAEQRELIEQRQKGIGEDITIASRLFFKQYAGLSKEEISTRFHQIIEKLKMKSKLKYLIGKIDPFLQFAEPEISLKILYIFDQTERTHTLSMTKWKKKEQDTRSKETLKILDESWNRGNGDRLNLLYHYQATMNDQGQAPLFHPMKGQKRRYETFRDVYQANHRFLQSLIDPNAHIDQLKKQWKKTRQENKKFLTAMIGKRASILKDAIESCEKRIDRQKNAFKHYKGMDQQEFKKIRTPHEPTPSAEHYTPEGLVLELVKAGEYAIVEALKSRYLKKTH